MHTTREIQQCASVLSSAPIGKKNRVQKNLCTAVLTTRGCCNLIELMQEIFRFDSKD